MSCPTCDATMENVGMTGNGGTCFLCPRCGTFVQYFSIGAPERHVYVPNLVERCRELRGTRPLENAWHTLGIEESINLPKDRPQ